MSILRFPSPYTSILNTASKRKLNKLSLENLAYPDQLMLILFLFHRNIKSSINMPYIIRRISAKISPN